jgi:hypothetical protein
MVKQKLKKYKCLISPQLALMYTLYGHPSRCLVMLAVYGKYPLISGLKRDGRITIGFLAESMGLSLSHSIQPKYGHAKPPTHGASGGGRSNTGITSHTHPTMNGLTPPLPVTPS